MPKFRKNPVVIEAFKLEENLSIAETPEWFQAAWKSKDVYQKGDDPLNLDVYIKTSEGDMRANKGDWIIEGVEGEIYPCKPSVFETSYSLDITDEAVKGTTYDLED
jgi:hypothetical protein